MTEITSLKIVKTAAPRTAKARTLSKRSSRSRGQVRAVASPARMAARNMQTWETNLADSKEPVVAALASPAMTELEIRIIRDGISPDVFYKVAKETDVPVADLAKALGMNERTIQRKKKACELLDMDMSERTFRGLKIWTMAKDTLDGIENPGEWIQGGVRSLGGATPLSMLGTSAGERKVAGVLEAIEYGIYL